MKKLQRNLSVLEHRAAPKATVRTLNVLAERSKTASAKNIAKNLGSRQAGVKRRIKGGKDNDELYGGADDDTIEGDLGADILQGNTGNDSLYGGGGDDYIRGGKDNDQLFGDDGDDIIRGDKGNDTLTGGAGNDSFFIDSEANSRDIITDFEVASLYEKLDLRNVGNAESFDELNIFDEAGQAVIDLGNGQSIKIQNASSSELTSADIRGSWSSEKTFNVYKVGALVDNIVDSVNSIQVVDALASKISGRLF